MSQPVFSLLFVCPDRKGIVAAVAGFLSDRREAFASWFSNTGDLGSHRDAKGHFARFFLFAEPGTALGQPGNFQNNAYTQPGDALANQPYSGFPRLEPFDPETNQEDSG